MTTNQPKVTDKPVARFNPVLDTEDGGYGFVTMKQSEHGQWVPLSTLTAQAAARVAAETELEQVRATYENLEASEIVTGYKNRADAADRDVATLKARIAELEVRFKSQIDYTLQWLRLTSHTRRRNNG